MQFSAWDGTGHRVATGVWVWDGAAYRSATGVWAWDETAWRQGFAASLGTLDAPSLTAAWNFSTHQMDVTVVKGANNPADTIYVISATGSGTGGSITGEGVYHDAAQPEDGSQSCYTAIATHANWADSAPSNESCANRGNVQ